MLTVLLYLNYKIYYQPEYITKEGIKINKEVFLQQQYLRQQLQKGAGKKMQAEYPEGFVFMHALYGLSRASIAKQSPPGSDLFKESLIEVDRSIEEIRSDYGKNPFDENLPLPYGAFYNGWLNYLVSKRLECDTTDQELKNLFISNCREIKNVLDKSDSPYLETYYSQVWPADVSLCIASLAIHDKIFYPQYTTTIQRWLNQIKANLDSHGLIPHSANYITGKATEKSRGSSQSLLLNFLIEIDTAFAKQQYSIYKKHFLEYTFGLPGIREYPIGETGEGDIDSGPVILNIGPAATIVGRKTCESFQDSKLAMEIRNGIEAFGFPVKKHDQKKYLAGMLPIADAFIVWSNTEDNLNYIPQNPYITFHSYSLAILLLLSFVTWRVLVFKWK
ncbi:MAG: hypothetical protein ACK40G_05190 [Cytophagaceae bacterium]